MPLSPELTGRRALAAVARPRVVGFVRIAVIRTLRRVVGLRLFSRISPNLGGMVGDSREAAVWPCAEKPSDFARVACL